MAPEVMKGLKHTGSVDYFAVGVITYELMMGKRPYVGKNRSEIKEQMMIKQVFLDEDNTPKGWSQESADFINRLLLRKDTKRLGYYNDLEVRKHPWLSSINFRDLINFKIESPFIPSKNYDNYDKQYCQEIEQIGITTKLRYEDYINDERYSGIFEGFTFYNMDETKIKNHKIYKKPNIKYIKNELNLNMNNNLVKKKYKTINIDYIDKLINHNLSQKLNKNISLIKNPNFTSKRVQNISPIKIDNPLTYRKGRDLNNKSLNYSNANESTNKKTPRTNLKDNENSSLINDNSKISLKNGEDIYIMASPMMSRGRINIDNNNNYIDNSFRKNANHSFVETNYSKGKILKRSYSSSKLDNNNNGNILNLLFNNINNIKKNENINGNYSYGHYSKINTPLNYNNINKEKTNSDKRPNYNYINYNNYNTSKSINHHHNISFLEKPKNNVPYLVNNTKLYYQYNSNNYNNNNNEFKFRNKNLNYIFDESSNNASKDNILKIKENNDIKRHYSNFMIKQKIPKNPINLKNRKIERKSNNMIDIGHKSMSFNKFQKIEPPHIKKNSNISLYIDKYGNNSYFREENNLNEKYKKEDNIIYNYKKFDKHNSMNNINNKQGDNSFNIEKNSYKRISNIIKYNLNCNHLNINSMNNNYYESNNKSNRNINNSNNKIIKNEKNLAYKQIPLPITDKKKHSKKMIKNNENEKSHNYNYSNPQINIINNNIINNNLIINSPINYNNENFNNNKDSKNTMFSKYLKIPFNNKLNNNNNSLKKEKNDIISKKKNEIAFCKYKYLDNFDKYKKIKNNTHNNKDIIDKNGNKHINNINNMIRKKIKEKYQTIK